MITPQEIERIVGERIRGFIHNAFFDGKVIFEIHCKDGKIDDVQFYSVQDKKRCMPSDIKILKKDNPSSSGRAFIP